MNETVICKDVFGKQYKTLAKDLELRVGVYAVIIENDKILLTRQWDGYSLVGGGLELGETIEESIVREVKEETGLTMVPDRIIHHATTFFKRHDSTRPRQSVQLYFTHSKLVGEIKNHALTDREKEYTRDIPEWVDLKDIGKITFRHSVNLPTLIKAYKKYYPDGNGKST